MGFENAEAMECEYAAMMGVIMLLEWGISTL